MLPYSCSEIYLAYIHDTTTHIGQQPFRVATTTTPPQPFYGPFPGPPGWAGARKELLDFTVQGKINKGRHTDHLAGRHSIRTNQCPPPPSPHIFLQAGCPSCRPTNSVKALKAGWPQNKRKKFPWFSRLFQSHNYTSPEVITTKSARNNDLHILRVIPHQLLLMWLTRACRIPYCSNQGLFVKHSSTRKWLE